MGATGHKECRKTGVSEATATPYWIMNSASCSPSINMTFCGTLVAYSVAPLLNELSLQFRAVRTERSITIKKVNTDYFDDNAE